MSGMDKDPRVSLLVATRNQLSILENHVTVADTEPVADTVICDGSALVNTLPPRTAQIFEDYALLDVLRTTRYLLTLATMTEQTLCLTYTDH